MQYTTTPLIIDKLIFKLFVEATTDGHTIIVNKLNVIKPTVWFNLPYQLNKLVEIIKDYQVILNDTILQNLIDEVAKISWFGYFKKVDLLVKIVERIETI